MPEITSIEAIRAKLREFNERVDGAITAAKTLARIRADAEKLILDIQGNSTRSEQSLQKAEVVRLELQELHREWQALKQQMTEAEERLRTANKTSLAEQADLLKRLDTSTRASADVAAKAQSTVAETAARLDGLLGTLREELHAEVHGKITKAEELLESEAQRVEKYLEQEQKTLHESVERQAGNYERQLREEMTAFKEDMKRNLAEHQQGIDRQLTDFLNKQNALIQNLSQQIDSFNRVSQAQSADLATTNTKVGELASAFTAHKATATNELAALAGGINELKTLLTEVQAGFRSQGDSVAALDTSLQETSTQLSQTIAKLRHLPLVGGKFK